MTNQEAIELLKDLRDLKNGEYADDCDKEVRDALGLAIRTLEILDEFEYYFVKELEQIKEEILTQNPKFTIGCEMKMCLEIIDNHISEIKGEKK